MAKTETIKKAIEKARQQLEDKNEEWVAYHRTAWQRLEQALLALDRAIKHEQAVATSGKEYFDKTTKVTGKTKLEKAND
jgi:hypothetical protein